MQVGKNCFVGFKELACDGFDAEGPTKLVGDGGDGRLTGGAEFIQCECDFGEAFDGGPGWRTDFVGKCAELRLAV
ncbi:MAG TPA: hypothetical protein PKI05_01580 [Thermogutta sp.]|nr:hypothetical protein [Thermogutta sp.]